MKLLGQLSSWSCLASSCFRLSEKKETVEMGDKSSHFNCLLFVNTLKLMTLPCRVFPFLSEITINIKYKWRIASGFLYKYSGQSPNY